MAIALLTLACFGTASLLATIVYGYLVPGSPTLVGTHFLLALGTTTILVMAHSFIMFFLLATGVELKELEQKRGWGESFRQRTIAMKGRVFPFMTVAILLVMANFISGAGVHTRAFPAWIHEALSWLTLIVCGIALVREYHVLGDNNRLIAEAARRRRIPGQGRA